MTTDNFIWSLFQKDTSRYTNKIKYLLTQYGTREPSNRFNIGNAIEFIISDLITDSDCLVQSFPNAKRIDLCINNDRNISIKYSSVGDIKLHNSNNQINKDMSMTNTTILVTPNYLYLLTSNALETCGIKIDEFLKDSGDGLLLRRRILKQLKKKGYPYIMKFDTRVDKSMCKNKLTSMVFYKYFTVEYEML